MIYSLREDYHSAYARQVENKKKKERQYEELMGEHERCLGDMKNLKRDLELLKEKAEKAKAVDSLKKLMVGGWKKCEINFLSFMNIKYLN